MRDSAKMHGMMLKDLDIFQQMIPLQKLQIMTFTYFFKVKIRNFNISETVRASTREMTLSTWRFSNI